MARHVCESLREDPDDLLVDGAYHPSELSSRVPHVLQLLGQEPVPLLERRKLLERERVHRSHETQLAIELADPCVSRDPGRELRTRCRRGVFRLALELAAQVLHGRLEPQPGLGALELDTLGELARLAQGVLGSRALLAQVPQAPGSLGDDELVAGSLRLQTVSGNRELAREADQLVAQAAESQPGGLESHPSRLCLQAGLFETC